MSEKDTQQKTGNKYGIDREKLKNAKAYSPIPGFGKKQESAQDEGQTKKGRMKMDLYQKIVGVLAVVVAILYCAVMGFANKGQMLINTSIQYWLWFAVIICVILFIGRYIMKIPKGAGGRKFAKIAVAIVSIVFIYMTYLSCIDGINASWQQCAEIKTEDGKGSVVVFRIDVDLTEDREETEETAEPAEDRADSYTLYSACPRINSMFCNSKATDDLIMVQDGMDVELKMEWIDGDLRLYVEEKALEGMDSILVKMD